MDSSARDAVPCQLSVLVCERIQLRPVTLERLFVTTEAVYDCCR